MVTGLLALPAIVHLRSVPLVAVCIIPIGVGGPLAMPVVTGVALDGVDLNWAGTASAVFNTFRQVGGAVAIAVFGSLIAGSPTLLPGMQASRAIAAALLLITAMISLRKPGGARRCPVGTSNRSWSSVRRCRWGVPPRWERLAATTRA